MTELRKVKIEDGDGTDLVDVLQNADDDSSAEDLYGIISMSVLMARLSSSATKTLRMDPATHSLQIIEFLNHKINVGENYTISESHIVNANDVYDIQITTPNTTTWAHMSANISAETEYAWYIYENVTINTAGTAKTPRNNNRNVADGSVLTIAGIANGSIADANADTDATGATLLRYGTIGAGKNQGTEPGREPLILKQNEDYCMRFVALTKGYVNYHLNWYEHIDKD